MNNISKNNNEFEPLHSKVFARWVSSQIKGVSNEKIENITKDLSNGVALVELAEILTHKKAPRNWDQSPNTDIKNVENCNLALKMFQDDGVKLIGISGKDISDKNQKLIFGLIWSLILHYSIGNSVFSFDDDETVVKNTKNNTKNEKITNNKTENEKDLFEVQENALLSWAQNRTINYKNVESFKPYELAICALLDSYFPEKIHFNSLNPQDGKDNLKLANDVMNQLGIQVFIYNDDISQNNNQVDRIALLTQLAAIKSALDNQKSSKLQKKLDEKESESEWDPETESQTEQISEAEAILEQKEILEELRIKKEEEKAKRKAALEARREYLNKRKLRKQLVLLKAQEEAKLRSEVAKSRQNEKTEEERIKFEEKRINAEEKRIESEKNRIKAKEQKLNDKMSQIKAEENEIKREKGLNNNENDEIINHESEKNEPDSQKTEQTKEIIDENEDSNLDDKHYTKIVTRKHYKIKIGIKSKNIDLNKIKKLNLGIKVDDNDLDNAKIVNEKGDAYIKLPLDGDDGQIVKRNMTVTVKKDGKVINVDNDPSIVKNNGEKQIYHVKLL